MCNVSMINESLQPEFENLRIENSLKIAKLRIVKLFI
jgi:hypothetical protein